MIDQKVVDNIWAYGTCKDSGEGRLRVLKVKGALPDVCSGELQAGRDAGSKIYCPFLCRLRTHLYQLRRSYQPGTDLLY